MEFSTRTAVLVILLVLLNTACQGPGPPGGAQVVTMVVTPTPDPVRLKHLEWAQRIFDYMILDLELGKRQNQWVLSGEQASATVAEACGICEQFDEELTNLEVLLLEVSPPDETAQQITDGLPRSDTLTETGTSCVQTVVCDRRQRLSRPGKHVVGRRQHC